MLEILGLSLFLLSAPPVQEKTPPPVKPVEQWRDVKGGKVRPLDQGDHKATVLLFIMTDCPIANSYAPEVNRITAEYGAKGIGFYIVYADSHVSDAAVRKHVYDYGYRCTALLDPSHTLAKWAGATISPEAVVIGAKRSIVYRGRIDDRMVDFGKMRHTPNHHDLRLTLDALLRGDAVPTAHTPCIGCFILSESEKH